MGSATAEPCYLNIVYSAALLSCVLPHSFVDLLSGTPRMLGFNIWEMKMPFRSCMLCLTGGHQLSLLEVG